MKTKASRLFASQCALLPTHQMHIYARLITLLYLKGYPTFRLHEKRINKALASLDH